MSDITKCANYLKCPLAKQCKRVLAKDNPHGWQSYSNFYVENKTECQYFIMMKERETKALSGRQGELVEVSQ